MAAARKKQANLGDGTEFDTAGATVIDRPFHDELAAAYLEYSYSVIYARALPDARDGLKPVHRRILWVLHRMGLRPDQSTAKSARIVGDVMGKYHPHGDSAIYEAMVRLAQDFSLSAPLVYGQGAFGTQDDGPAASRYTEARMSLAGSYMLGGIDEDAVDMRDNYDQTRKEPRILPAAFPNALVNGGSGIAVGMATNMIPHNLGEATEAARYLLAHPDATLDEVMKIVPGPDLPTGGIILGADKIRQAYETGRGVVRIRARIEIEPVAGSRGRQAIVATELPYGVGPEKVIEAIRAAVAAGKLQSVADVKDLTDISTDGIRLVIECRTGVNPQAVLADLYKLTPMEISFGIINNVLHDGKPKELGLLALLRIFLAHRTDVVTRRTRFRLGKAESRRHLVEGLLVALDNVDAVVRIIRTSKSAAEARTRLLAELGGAEVRLGATAERRTLDDGQVGHILEMPLRRLVSLEVDTLRGEWDELTESITLLNRILNDEDVRRDVIDGELVDVIAHCATPRRTTLADGDLKDALDADNPPPLEIPDDPCTVTLSTTGLIGRFDAGWKRAGRAGRDDLISMQVATTARATLAAVTTAGRMLHLAAMAIPAPADGDVKFRGVPVAEVADLLPGERIVTLCRFGTDAPMLALASRAGLVKRLAAADFPKRSGQDIISFKTDGDELAGAAALPADQDAADLVFVTSAGQLLRTPAGGVRPQGRAGAGMAGVKLGEGDHVVAFTAAPLADIPNYGVATATDTGAVKVTPLGQYPAKGRATAGVRCMRFLRGESEVAAALIASGPVAGVGPAGGPVSLPESTDRRDASGAKMSTPVAGFATLR